MYSSWDNTKASQIAVSQRQEHFNLYKTYKTHLNQYCSPVIPAWNMTLHGGYTLEGYSNLL